MGAAVLEYQGHVATKHFIRIGSKVPSVMLARYSFQILSWPQ